MKKKLYNLGTWTNRIHVQRIIVHIGQYGVHVFMLIVGNDHITQLQSVANAMSNRYWYYIYLRTYGWSLYIHN